MQKQNVVKRVTGSTACMVITLTKQLRDIGVGLGDPVDVQWSDKNITITGANER